MVLFLCLSGISMEQYCQNSLAKWGGRGVRKKYKKGDVHIGRGVSIEGGSNLLHTMGVLIYNSRKMLHPKMRLHPLCMLLCQLISSYILVMMLRC